MNIEVRGDEFILHPQNILIWPEQKMMVVADLHLGKAQTFQKHGLWLPEAAHRDELASLSGVIFEHSIKHLVFLGDFVHAAVGVTTEIVELFATWLKAQSTPKLTHTKTGKLKAGVDKLRCTVVVGNHDRGTVKKWPEAWSHVKLADKLIVGEHCFQHEPPTEDESFEKYIWSGHLHPKLRLKLGADQMRLPVFMIGPQYAYLPAYSSLAGGMDIKPEKDQRFFVSSEEGVFEVKP